MTRNELEKRIDKTKTKIDNYQEEYFTLLFDMINNKEDLITEKKGYNYYWERLKELQLTINIFSNIHRDISIDIAKSALEEAFTPRIKEMLMEKLEKENDDDK
jgi:hypothetical protein